MNRSRSAAILLTISLVLQACAISSVVTPSQDALVPELSEQISPAPISEEIESAPQPEHRIGVREVDGVGEFYDRLTGEKFIPRGNNHISLDPMVKKGGGQVISFSIFNQGFYDHAEANEVLAQMHAAGYNVVRIFIESEGEDGLGSTNGLDPEYMDNLADFLKVAKENEIYAIFAKQWLPITPRYGDIIAKQCCSTFGFANAIHMAPAGVEAHQIFFQDLIKALAARNAPLDAIFSYNVSNEFYFDADQPPLSWTSWVAWKEIQVFGE